jgi:catechol-2,3-dioxygenase
LAGLSTTAVADRDELQRWVTYLEAKGVAHWGITDMWYGPTLVFRDPDNIQLELFVTPLAEEVARLITEADSPDVRALQESVQQRTSGEAERS